MNGTGIYWFTGLSGSGKTTLSREVARLLTGRGLKHCVLDGDVLRDGLCADLGFRPKDRAENIRRAGEMARLLAEQGVICLCAFITPMEVMLRRLHEKLGPALNFVFVDCPLSVCKERDPKGNYHRAEAGEIANDTRLNAPFEPPADPEIHLDTTSHGVAECAEIVFWQILCNERCGEI